MSGHFVDTLRSTFTDSANRTALIYDDQAFSYGDLDRRVRNFAARLQALGVAPGDRVAVLTSAKLPFLAAHLGAMFAGAVSLPLNPRFTRDEIRFFLSDSAARVAVAGAETLPVIDELRAELPTLHSLLPDSEAWDAPAATFREPSSSSDDPCLILYSSGTTGRPKGVVHGQGNFASSLGALRDCWRYSPDDVLINALPLFHIHGLAFASHLTLMTGACMRVEESFHPKRTLEAIGKGTIFMAVPTFYYAFLERPEFRTAATGWQHVRLFTCGSAPIRPDVLPELESILNHPVINRYGMTEGHVISSLPLDGPWPMGSVGLPLAGIEVRIRGNDGADAAPNEVGAVSLRGPNLFREYWNMPDATRAALATGWFESGDMGRLDDAGFLTLSGRKNDLIITNGFNVYPQVVERAINECPGVKESAVLGLPDDRRGERVAVALVRDDPALTERAVRDFCKEKLVDYQRPVVIRFVDALPRNALGKVLRRELPDLF